MNYRIQELARINQRIKDIETSKDRIVESNRNILSQGYNADFVLQKKQKNLEQIQKYEEEITSLKDRVLKLQRGELDIEFQKVAATNKETQNKNKQQKTQEKTKQKQDEKKKMQQVYDSANMEYREEREYTRNADNGYKYYRRVVDSVPKYILDNLKTMPHNKGYIWKDVWFFGDLESDNNHEVITMFQPNGIRNTLIHSITRYAYTIHQKVNNTKQLVWKKIRK
jgi:hypothetical protein